MVEHVLVRQRLGMTPSGQVPARRTPLGVGLLILICLLAAASAVWALPGPIGPDSSPVIAGLVGLGTLLTESRPVHVAHAGERRTFTFAEAPLIIGLVLSPGLALVVGFSLAILLVQLARRLPAAKVRFNIAQYAAASSLAVLCSVRLPGLLGVLLGVAVFCLVNDLAVQVVLRLTSGRALRLPFAERAVMGMLYLAGTISAAVLVGRVMEVDGSLSLAFLAPIALLVHSQRSATQEHLSRQVLHSIAEQALSAQVGDRRAMGVLLARTARELLAAGEAQVLLLEGLRPTLLQVLGGQAVAERQVDRDWYTASTWYREAFEAGGHGVVRGHWVGLVVGEPLHPLALIALTRSEGEEPFREEDLPGLRQLADLAAGWLREPETTGAQVIDLVQQERRGLVTRTDLVGELDRLRRGLDSLGSEQATAGRSEDLAVAQRRLTELVIEMLSQASNPEEQVSLGSWPRPRVAEGS